MTVGRRHRRIGQIGMGLAMLVGLRAGAAAEAGNAHVVQFAPQGVVKHIRQVTARFSEPMVPLGDPRSVANPFAIDCSEKGTARWVDSRTWAYDFNRDLPAAVRCRFRVRPGLTTLSQQPIGGTQSFAFSTGGPSITSSTPTEGSRDIEEEQAFVLVLDGEATEASILDNVRFSIEGMPQPVGIRVVTGDDRAAILETFWRGALSGPIVVLQARQRFPNGAKVRLIWGKGVTAHNGVTGTQDQVLEFKTRKAFSARFHCDRENAKANCIPVAPMSVRFSAPVGWNLAGKIVVVGPDGRRWTPEPSDTPQAFVDRVDFKGPFPESATFRIELPPDFHDDAGRTLINGASYPLSVKTDAFPPLAKFSARFGIIESKTEPVLPVTLRNLEPEIQARLERISGAVEKISPEHPEQILAWLRKVGRARRSVSVFADQSASDESVKSFTLPKPNGVQAFEVVGIPFESPGLYVVELASPRLGASLLGKEQPMYVPAAALVTNLSVHFKGGRENSLVWVTTLDNAHPVTGARVSVHDCTGSVRWSGKTDGQGIARIDHLPGGAALPSCYQPLGAHDEAVDYFSDYTQTRALSPLSHGLFVIAQTDDDMSFVHSDWIDGIEPWRFQLPPENWLGPTVARTIFDRSLFRAGETVHMKHLLRTQTLNGFAVPPAADRPKRVSIQHIGSDEKYEFPLQWDDAGVAETTWEIPKEAKLGGYQVVLARETEKPWQGTLVSGGFRVEEFRVPLMKAVVHLPAEPQVRAAVVPVDVNVQYLAGGAADGLPVVLRAQIRTKTFESAPEFDRFTFANGAVKEGVVRRGVSEEETDEENPPANEKPGVHQRQDLTLDGAGALHSTVTDLPPADTLRELLTEIEFRDPNGEVQTVSSTVPLWPAKLLVGIKVENWATSSKQIEARMAVVDLGGKAVAGAPVRVEVRQRRTYSYRKRLVGGFYAYENVEEIGPPLATLCEGRTNAGGLLLCTGRAPTDGNLILQAAVTDDNSNATVAHGDVWVSGTSDLWFPAEDSDRIDVLPEKPRYEPGETARFQVRMPFREATALVTTEREGILEASVVRLSGKDPVVEVPVKGAYAPNMFVSVLAVRGRVGDVQPTAMVDLGKPAYKLGIAEIQVGWGAHALKVSVTSDREVYHVRDKAAVQIAVRTAEGKAPPAGSEVAVAAVDEGLLELSRNRSWDLLEAMMGRRGYAVRTATAQMQVVGKRHYGLKALPQGGGGGRQTTRELFDTLLLWKGRVPLDAGGHASVEVPLNDSLTSFRIVAVATGDVGQFGTGSTSIRSTQDLMILPGIAPLAREGDQFRAEVTLRNTTAHAMDVAASGRVEGLAEPLAPQTVTLAPNAAQVIGWDLTVPVGVEALRYEIEAGEHGGPTDRVRATQRVRPAVPVRVLQATLLRWEHPLHQPVQRPVDAIPGRGGVRVNLAPTLTAGLDGVRQWMRGYPYVCLEQRVSRAVALNDPDMWSGVAAALPSYMDADGLLKYFPAMLSGSDVLTSYVLAIAHEAGFAIPDDVQNRMEEGLAKFVGGSILRDSPFPVADLSIRKLGAVEALARVGKAQPALLASIAIEPNLWPTSAVLDWWSILQRLTSVPERAKRLSEVEQIVRARLNLQGTTMGFSTERGDDLWWLMVCPDTSAVRLVLHLLDFDLWKDDLPQLVRGAMGRQQRGTWDCTLTNAWGTLAVRKFSQVFDSTPVTGTTIASLGDASEVRQWTEPPKDMSLDFAWPSGPADLTIHHTGTGSPWVTIQSRAAIPLEKPLSTGYRITKTIAALEPRAPGHFSRGDRLRVRLEVDAQSDMTWVVVNDPIPAGASHLGTGLARDSKIATQGETHSGDAWPAFEERAFEAYRAYYEFVAKGNFVTEYTIRLNQDGRFQLPPTRVEALYAPEMFGELPNARMEVQP